MFLSLFKNFSAVLTERIPDAFKDGTLQQSSQTNEMAIDLEDSSAMELDKEKGKPEKRFHVSLCQFKFSIIISMEVVC